MSLPGQSVNPERYLVSPRTLSFLLREERVLLQKIPTTKGAWAGLWNGVGGHVESGEDIYTSALREIAEETNLRPNQFKLVGINMIDLKDQPGISTHIFMGVSDSGDFAASSEGELNWHPIAELNGGHLVEDVLELIELGMNSYHQGEVFYGLYNFSLGGERKAFFRT